MASVAGIRNARASATKPKARMRKIPRTGQFVPWCPLRAVARLLAARAPGALAGSGAAGGSDGRSGCFGGTVWANGSPSG